jgi:hypothetical protein
MRKVLLAATAMAWALAMTTLPAKADIVLGGQNWSFNGLDTLTLTPVVPGGNQPLNVQCIICGDNQPQQSPTFGYTNFKNAGNQSSEVYFSSNILGGGNPGSDTVGIGYDGTFLRNYLIASNDPTLTFTVGVDANDTNQPQTLQSFFLLNLTTHTVLSAFINGTAGNIASQNNGTGFPDYTLGTFNITVGQDIHLGDQLIFYANIQNSNDGPDSFFIQPVAVPGPIAGAGLPGILAACVGLWGLAMKRKRRKGLVSVASA